MGDRVQVVRECDNNDIIVVILLLYCCCIIKRRLGWVQNDFGRDTLAAESARRRRRREL